MLTFDIKAKTYTIEDKAKMPMRSTNSTTLYLPAQKKVLYLAGTNSDYQKHGRVWCYDVATDSWSELKSLTEPRILLTACLIHQSQQIFVMGGETEDGTTLTAETISVADLLCEMVEWTQFTPDKDSFGLQRSKMVTFGVGSDVIVVGGEGVGLTSDATIFKSSFSMDTTEGAGHKGTEIGEADNISVERGQPAVMGPSGTVFAICESTIGEYVRPCILSYNTM